MNKILIFCLLVSIKVNSAETYWKCISNVDNSEIYFLSEMTEEEVLKIWAEDDVTCVLITDEEYYRRFHENPDNGN